MEVRFYIETEFLGVEWEEIRHYDLEDYESEEEMLEDIREDCEDWRDDIVNSFNYGWE